MSLEMKKIEDKTIYRLMDKFTSHLDVDDILLAKCLSKELITEDNMSKIGDIFRGGRTAEAAMKLMSHVKRSAPGYLKTLCDILSDSKSSFLVPCIEEECRIQCEENGKPVSCIFSPPIATTHDCSPFRATQPLRPLIYVNEDNPDDDHMHDHDELLSIMRRYSIIRAYFELSCKKYGITFPENLFPANKANQRVLEDCPIAFQAVPNMVHEVEDVLEGASLRESVERLKGLPFNSDNVRNQFTETISPVLDTGPPSWKKVVMFFSSGAAFGINLCTNNMGHLATQLLAWMAQVLQDRLQPWIDDQGGWVSTEYCMARVFKV